ncbi:MAG: ATP-dependent Clp protease ATP-binding subunit [Candidatus Bostrichicola ureolyticus]|nr:MAG: ATP-dependent Clp protease ATP-binding subunit [Candidatus Bostrichicola ureolyticus]
MLDEHFENINYIGESDNLSGKTNMFRKTDKTPILDNFSQDLTMMALEGKLDSLIGRDKEIERVSQILSRRKKNNPLLIGEPGVGKSAIAEGLAVRIIKRQVSRVLYNKRVITLNISDIVSGTKYRGQFEERAIAILNELQKNPNIIIFIDEIHTLIGAGGTTGSLDASNILKPALAKGEIKCIGATTLNEYKQYIEKDGALARRFQKILIEPTTEVETIKILNEIKDKYQKHHNVIYTDEAIKACVYLSSRYITDRNLPDKAIDAMDEAGSHVHIKNFKVSSEIINLEKKLNDIRNKKYQVVKNQNYEEAARLRDNEKCIEQELYKAQDLWDKISRETKEIVVKQDIAEVVSTISGIPIGRKTNENKKILNLTKKIKKQIIGQDQAIEKIVKAIKRNIVGLKDPNRPIGSFLFIGDTGVGKTHLAKIIANEFFDTYDAFVRIDMSEYMEKFSVSRLLGAPPGYIGYEEGGQLTEIIRRKPYALILLDEIDKAHTEICNLLLQIFDDGFITDSSGNKVFFQNTIFILTSNLGIRESKELGYETNYEINQLKINSIIIENTLKRTFSNEFLNRIDEIIIFNSLEEKHIYEIINLELEKLINRIHKLGYELNLSSNIKKFLLKKGYNKNYGARNLKRVLYNYIENPIAEKIIDNQIKIGDKLSFNLKKDKLKLIINK